MIFQMDFSRIRSSISLFFLAPFPSRQLRLLVVSPHVVYHVQSPACVPSRLSRTAESAGAGGDVFYDGRGRDHRLRVRRHRHLSPVVTQDPSLLAAGDGSLLQENWLLAPCRQDREEE